MRRAAVGRSLPLWLVVVLGVAGTAVALWGMRAAAPVLGPVLLALVLTVAVHPLTAGLIGRGAPRWSAVALAVLVVDGGLIAFTLAIVLSLGRLATLLPGYSEQWQDLLDGLRDALAAAGIGPDQVEALLSSLDPASVVAGLTGFLSGMAGATAALVLLLATVLFMTVDAAGLPERLGAVPGVSAHLTAALGRFAGSTRRYIVVTTVFGFAVAVVDTVALFLLGIPLPLLWGLLSFLTNYVPNIGFFLGLVPPALLALLVEGPRLALVVVLVYVLANFVLQSLVQPVFVGDAVGLSVTVTFLSVIAWTFVMGPLGAVLAVPLTLLVYAVLVDQDPERGWARALLAGPSDAPIPVSSGSAARRRPVRRPPGTRRVAQRAARRGVAGRGVAGRGADPAVVPPRSSAEDDARGSGREAPWQGPAAGDGRLGSQHR
jgi:predicted PurR-regulated permease PerM